MRRNRLIAAICLVALPLAAFAPFLESHGAPKRLQATVAQYAYDTDGVKVEITTEIPLGESTQVQVKKIQGPPRLHTIMTSPVQGRTNTVWIRLPTKAQQWSIIHKVTRPSMWEPISGILFQGANLCPIACVASFSEALLEKVRDESGSVQIYRSDIFDVPAFALDSAHNEQLQATTP